MLTECEFEEARIDEIRSILIDIVQLGILRTRASGWDGDAARCSIEADHIHNLPSLILQPRLRPLAHYFEVERPAFIRSVVDSRGFESHWSRLKDLLGEMRAPVTSAES